MGWVGGYPCFVRGGLWEGGWVGGHVPGEEDEEGEEEEEEGVVGIGGEELGEHTNYKGDIGSTGT